MLLRLRRVLKQPRTVVTLVVGVVVLGGVYLRYRGEFPAAHETVVAARGTVLQEVSITGRVKPAEVVDLAFERGGRVAVLAVAVGSTVRAGEVLVSLERAALSADLARAEAALAGEGAKLAELERGTRPEELVVAEAKVSEARQLVVDAEVNSVNVARQAQVELANLYDDVPDILNDAYAKADDAVSKQVDEFFTDDGTNPRLTFVTSNSQAQVDVERMRLELNGTLAAFRAEVGTLTTDQAELDAALDEAAAHLEAVRNLLVRLYDTVNTPNSLSQATLATYKGNLNTARANVNTAASSINTQRQTIAAERHTNETDVAAAAAKVRAAESALTVAERELALKQAGATPEQLSVQRAAVHEAEAVVANARAELATATLRSPLPGVVTKSDVEVGEIVAVNVPVISVISEAEFEIEADVPEADIAKVHRAQAATVTLDAYGDDVVFQATVSEVDPAETLIEGVATYQVTIQFTESDARVKSGMTANVVVAGERRDNVIVVPQRALRSRDGQTLVQILKGETPEDVVVAIGLRGSDGNVEIISGLVEGDRVIVSSGRATR